MSILTGTIVLAAGVAQQLAANDRAAGDDGDTVRVLVKNASAATPATVYLGGSDVTNAAGAKPGFPWVQAEPQPTIALEPGETLWGVTDAATSNQTIKTLRSGR